MQPDLLAQIFSRHAVYIEGYKTQTINDFEPFLKKIQQGVLTELADIDDLTSFKARRLNKLLKVISKSLDAGFLNYQTAWQKSLLELAEYERDFTIKAIGQVAAVDMFAPAPAQIMTAAFSRPLHVKGIEGKLLKTFYEDWSQKTKDRVTGAIRLGVAQGQTIEQLVRALKGTQKARYRDGLLDATRRDLGLIVKTSIAHVNAQARAVVYERNADIVKGEEFLAVLDGRTSELCRSLSGREFDVGKGPMPPLHMACRSLRVPVLDDGLDFLDGAGRQFARGAKGVERVRADLTYYEWLKTQPKGFQDDVLGKTRGQLFRKGGLTSKRFGQLQLDKNFKPRTLVEIRRLEQEAFDKAFTPASGPKLPKGAKAKIDAERAKVSAFNYLKLKPPQTVSEAEKFVVDNGIAKEANLKGISIKSVPDAFIAAAEVVERFGLSRLEGVGPSTRFGLQKVNANAAVFTGGRFSKGEGFLHLPTKFGNNSYFDEHQRIAQIDALQYQSQHKSLLSRKSVSSEVKDRAAKMEPNDYNFTVSSLEKSGRAQVDIIYHEFGHVLHLVNQRMGPEIEKFLSTGNPISKGWSYLLSEYASYSPAEFIAESFNLYMRGTKYHFRIHPDLLDIFERFDKKK